MTLLTCKTFSSQTLLAWMLQCVNACMCVNACGGGCFEKYELPKTYGIQACSNWKMQHCNIHNENSRVPQGAALRGLGVIPACASATAMKVDRCTLIKGSGQCEVYCVVYIVSSL